MESTVIPFMRKLLCYLLAGLFVFLLFSCGSEKSFPTETGLYIDDHGNYVKVTGVEKQYTLKTLTDSLPFYSENVSFIYVGPMERRYRNIDVDLERVHSAPRVSYFYHYWDRYWDRQKGEYRYRKATEYNHYQRADYLISAIAERYVEFLQFEEPLYFYSKGEERIEWDFEWEPLESMPPDQDQRTDRYRSQGMPSLIRAHIKPRQPLQPGIYRIDDYYFAVGDEERIVQQILDDHLELCEEYGFRQGMARIYKLLLEKFPSEHLERYLTEHFLEPYDRTPIKALIDIQDVAVSASGKTIAFTRAVEGKPELYLYFLANDSTVRLTASPEAELDPRFSPDSRRVAFIRRGKQKYALCLADGSTGAIRVLAEVPQQIAFPLFSPDGQQILFRRTYRTKKGGVRAQHIFAYDLARDSLYQLTSTTLINGNSTFSPDGNTIAFVSRKGRQSAIYLMDVQGENLRRLTPEGVNAEHPVFSPDGKFVYYTGERHGRTDIYRISISGEQDSCLVNINAGNACPLVSAQGNRLFFLSQAGKEINLYALDLHEGTFQRLTYPEMYENFALKDHPRPFAAQIRGDSLFVLVRKQIGLKEYRLDLHLIDFSKPLRQNRDLLIAKLESIAAVQVEPKEYDPRDKDELIAVGERFVQTAFQEDRDRRGEAAQYMIDGMKPDFLKNSHLARIVKVETARGKIRSWRSRNYRTIDLVEMSVQGELTDYTGLKKQYEAELTLNLTGEGWKVAQLDQLRMWF